MSETIQERIAYLLEAVKTDMSSNTTSVTIFINCEGAHFESRIKTPEQLKKSGISMRNISGEWIK